MNIALVDIGGTAVKSALWSEDKLTNLVEVPTAITADDNMITCCSAASNFLQLVIRGKCEVK